MQQKNTDTELIHDVLNGNKAAYGVLINRHQRFVFTLALRFTKKREDAEEVAQDSFIKAYRSLHSFQQTSKFSTWLYSIVYTTSMTFLRKRKWDTIDIDDENSVIQLEAYSSSFDESLERKSRSVYIQKAIDLLLPDDASIITLFYNGEQSLEEIGKVMGIDKNTVKVKLHRARNRLRTKLELLLKDEAKELL